MVFSLFTWEPGELDAPEPHRAEYYVRHFGELVRYFDDIFDFYQRFFRDLNCTDCDPLGGFEVELRASDGRTLRVGIGTEQWLLYEDLNADGFITDGNTSRRELIFYLEAWHWTPFCESDLISKEECLLYVARWLARHADQETALPSHAPKDVS